MDNVYISFYGRETGIERVCVCIGWRQKLLHVKRALKSRTLAVLISGHLVCCTSTVLWHTHEVDKWHSTNKYS